MTVRTGYIDDLADGINSYAVAGVPMGSPNYFWDVLPDYYAAAQVYKARAGDTTPVAIPRYNLTVPVQNRVMAIPVANRTFVVPTRQRASS